MGDVISENFPNWEMRSQDRIRRLDRDEKLLLKPDILLRNTKNGKIVIIDAKYKKSDNNADYYQVLCYLLSDKNSKEGYLLYPSSDSSKKDKVCFSRNLDQDPIEYDLPIFSKEIDLETKNNTSKEFNKKMKQEVYSLLKNSLSEN